MAANIKSSASQPKTRLMREEWTTVYKRNAAMGSIVYIGGPCMCLPKAGANPKKGVKGGGAIHTKLRASKGEGPTPRRAPMRGGGHYRFCSLSPLLIAICTLR